MNPHPRAFDPAVSLSLPQSVPLRCRTPMPAQSIEVPTPISVLGSLAMALLSLPRQAVLAPAPRPIPVKNRDA